MQKSAHYEMVIDTGWVFICQVCDVRHGGEKFGPRELAIKPCKKCITRMGTTSRYKGENNIGQMMRLAKSGNRLNRLGQPGSEIFVHTNSGSARCMGKT